MKKLSQTLVTCALFCCPAALFAGGRTINWQNELGHQNYDSNGGTWEAANFTFALGAFDAGFTPTSENLNEWLDNWNLFDTASYDQTTELQMFNGTATLEDNSIFTTSTQAYMWVYNSTSLTSGTEWFLVTDDSSDSVTADDWIFPEAPGSQQAQPLDWVLTPDFNSYNVIFGGAGGTQGAGEYTVTPGDMGLQSHSVVPEPTSGTVLMAGAGLLLLRRRRTNVI